MTPYRRMISYVRPHLGNLYVAFFSMFMNSIFSGFPVIGLIIPFVDTILAGKVQSRVLVRRVALNDYTKKSD